MRPVAFSMGAHLLVMGSNWYTMQLLHGSLSFRVVSMRNRALTLTYRVAKWAGGALGLSVGLMFNAQAQMPARFFPTQAEAQAACQATGQVNGTCTNGVLYTRYCASIQSFYDTNERSWTIVEQQYRAGIPGGSCTVNEFTKYTYNVYPTVGCPAGTTFVGPTFSDCVPDGYAQTTEEESKSQGNPANNAGSCQVGNPCNAGNGNKFQSEADIDAANVGVGVPTFVRSYNSQITRNLAGLGVGWTHNHNRRLDITGTGVVAWRGDGQALSFTGSGVGMWSADPDVKLKLTKEASGFTLVQPNGTVERYSLTGQITSETDAAGLATLYTYNSNVTLNKVTGPFGHTITFTWSGSRLASIKDSANQTITFTADAQKNLSAVTYPGNKVRTYLYEDTTFRHALTGIKDETNTRVSTYAYDASTGKAFSTSHTGGYNGFTLVPSGTSTTITDAGGTVRTATFTDLLGVKRLSSLVNQADGKAMSQSYDAQGNVEQILDEEGRTSKFSWDANNRIVTKTLAFGRPEQKTWSYTYADPILNLLSTVTEPSVRAGQSKVTSYSYGDVNFPKLPTLITVSGYTPAGFAVARTVALGYTPLGQLATINGPRTDVSDVTTLTYWSCSAGANCGQLKQVTNAAGHITTFDVYDAAGRLKQKTDPNGLVTTFGYDLRGRLETVTQTPPVGSGTAARGVSYTYDSAGQLVSVTTAEGIVLTSAYDAAGNLTSITDPLGNKVIYGYDLRGNRTSETVRDAGGNVVKQIASTWDARNFLGSVTKGTGSISATTQLVNDAVGNLVQVSDAKGNPPTTHQYDGLNRLIQTVDAISGTTTKGYDPNGEPITVGSPNGAAWGFDVDDLGNKLQERSPDRGEVNMVADAAGNVTSRTDARGITATLSHDALNRVNSVTYPSGSSNVSYTYDTCAYGKGRVCSITDPSGTRTFTYDGLGRVKQQVWLASSGLGGQAFTTSYTWTAGDRLASMTFPSGRTVTIGRNALAQVNTVATNGSTLVSGRTYNAEGAQLSQSLANGLSEARTWDTAGRLSTWSVGALENRTLGYDLNANLTSVTGSPIGSRAYGYDALDRLNSEPSWSYTYDGNGNRLSDGASSYNYAANSNRLASVGGASVSLDTAGNTLGLTLGTSSQTYTYNQAGRLATAGTSASSASYFYREDGLRAAKVVAGPTAGTTLFHFDLDGNVIAETDAAGTVLREVVWADGLPVAQVDPAAGTTWLHVDHLGTPRVGTSSAGAVTWRWDSNAFGSTPPTGTTTVNLRMPGQIYDAETGLYFNGWRTYSPHLGRYLESDPISLNGGLNTYAYVAANPLNYTDPMGLQAIPVPPVIPIPGVPNPSMDAQRNLADRLSRAFRSDEETTYQTYTRYNPRTGDCYSGRTSGTDTPENNVRNRGYGQPILNAEGFLPPVLDRSSTNYNAIRGREQQLIDVNGGAQSTGGTSRNKINGISPINPRGPFVYIPAANAEFGAPVPAGKCTCQ